MFLAGVVCLVILAVVIVLIYYSRSCVNQTEIN